MAASQLEIYNDALLLCEERLLASVTEARKPRYLLDQVWNGGGVKQCLEAGYWTFATRTVSISNDPNIQPSFGYINAFAKPADYVRTAALASDPYFNSALTAVADENGFWWADIMPLFVKYTSDDPAYGMNLTLWPETFKQFVAAYFAKRIVKNLTHSKEIQDRVEMALKSNRAAALGTDGMNEPTKFFSRGQLSRARQGMYQGRPWGSGQGWY